jgi:hypothetical protein
LLRLLLLLRRTLAVRRRLTGTAASATASPLAQCLLFARRALRLLLLRRTLRPRLLRTLRAFRTRSALLLLLLRAAALFLRLALTVAAIALALPLALRLLRLLALVLARLLAGALLEIAQLLVHVARRLALLLQAELVMPAIRAALPSLGIGLLTGRAKDTFRERHREIGAHCTLRAVEESRRRTLLTLIELAGENSPSACWDDQRAIDLLRRQATAEELRELGVDERLIAHVFAEEHAG